MGLCCGAEGFWVDVGGEVWVILVYVYFIRYVWACVKSCHLVNCVYLH